MHVISGELRNLKRRSKPIMHPLAIVAVNQNADLDRAAKCANEWMNDELAEPEPVWLQYTKDRVSVVTSISLASLNSLNRKYAPERFAGFNEYGRPLFARYDQ